MPTYTYACEQCQTRFEVFASIKQKASGWQPACPQCGSKHTRQTFEKVTVISGPRSPAPGGSCCSLPPRKK